MYIAFFHSIEKMYMAFQSYLLIIIIVTRLYLLKRSPIVKPFTLKHGFFVFQQCYVQKYVNAAGHLMYDLGCADHYVRVV